MNIQQQVRFTRKNCRVNSEVNLTRKLNKRDQQSYLSFNLHLNVQQSTYDRC